MKVVRGKHDDELGEQRRKRRLEGVVVAEGSGWPWTCLDDPTELPYARQMPRLVSSGRWQWRISKMVPKECCVLIRGMLCVWGITISESLGNSSRFQTYSKMDHPDFFFFTAVFD